VACEYVYNLKLHQADFFIYFIWKNCFILYEILYDSFIIYNLIFENFTIQA
jgi:hypothetical protein